MRSPDHLRASRPAWHRTTRWHVAARMSRATATSAAMTLLPVVLWWGTSDPVAAVLGGSAGFETLFACAAAVLAWLLAGWLLLTTVVTAMTGVPGRMGRAALWCAERLAPLVLRNTIRVALGLATAAAPLAAVGQVAAASPADPLAGMPVGHASGTQVIDELPDVGRPLPARRCLRPSRDVAAERRPATPGHDHAADTVTVQAGDSLWVIAANQLDADATNADISRAWHRWYAANIDMIGADPDLVHPGQSLRPPGSGE